jgi:hypothetical protein
MSPEEIRDRAIELLCAPRSIEAYVALLDELAEQQAIDTEDDLDCDEPHCTDGDCVPFEEPGPVEILTVTPGGAVTREEIGEGVALWRNGAGSVVSIEVDDAQHVHAR